MIALLVITLLIGVAAYLLGQRAGRQTSDTLAAERTRAELAAASATARAQSAEDQRDQASRQAHEALTRVIELETANARLSEKAAASEAQVARERELLSKTKQELTDTFKALAGEALSASSSQFLKLAAERFTNLQNGATTELEQRRLAIENLVKPVAESLGKVEKQIGDIEKNRVGSYENLLAVVNNLQSTQQDLRRETGNLVGALRRPNVRGRWGELQLRRVVEPIITLGKKPSLANRRLAFNRLRDRDAVVKLFGEIGQKYGLSADASVSLDDFRTLRHLLDYMLPRVAGSAADRKSTRLNSSHT